MTKPTKWPMRPVLSESLLSAWRNLGSLPTHLEHREDSDQTGRMPRLIWVFAGCTCHFVGFVVRQLIFWIKMGIDWSDSHAGCCQQILQYLHLYEYSWMCRVKFSIEMRMKGFCRIISEFLVWWHLSPHFFWKFGAVCHLVFNKIAYFVQWPPAGRYWLFGGLEICIFAHIGLHAFQTLSRYGLHAY